MTVTIRHLDQFLCVAEQGSISKAAQRLGLSQPAITKSLQRLEKDFGVTLLLRNRQGVQLTKFGQCLYKHAKRIEKELSRTTQDLEELLGTHEGLVSVGAIPTVARGPLPRAIIELNRSHPGIVVSVTEQGYPELLAGFDAGEFDFIIGILDQEDLDSSYVIRTLFYDHVRAVVRRNHPLTKLEKITPSDLLVYPWIYPKKGGMRRKRIDDYFQSFGLFPPEAIIEGSSTSLKQAILQDSDLITALPESFVMSEETSKRLVALELDPPILSRPIGIIHRGSNSLSNPVQALLSTIVKVCQKSS